MTAELNQATKEYIGQCISTRYQELILLPTEKCNFRCTYCYEDFELGKMSRDTIDGIKNFISQRVAAIDKLHLSWFGGEPLLAKEIVLEIAEHAFIEAQKNNVELSGGFTTNAYLLDQALFQRFVALKQNHYQISLDGWEDVHDTTRKRADGKGTFDVIWKNINTYKAVAGDFQVVFRIHITDDNKESLKKLCLELGKRFNDDPRFTLNVQDIRDLGGDGGKDIKRISQEEYLVTEALLSAIYYGEELSDVAPNMASNEVRSESLSPLSETAGEGSTIKYICYAARPNSILIRSDGSIGKCTVLLGDTRNTLGKIAKDGSLDINNEKLKPWLKGFSNLSNKALACPAPYLDEKFEQLERIDIAQSI
ncbi:MAG: radical SAM protein [Gammaproteobacteria bacterium]|nr:radical SAM protein [Gammaproteobacteria bacterium]